MGRKSDALELSERWTEERKIFPEALLNKLADMPLPEIKRVCEAEFGQDAAAVQWQAMITKAHRSPADFAEITSGGSWRRSPHLDLLNDLFVDACYNQRYIIVSVSIRHGKSMLMSEYAPAWYLSKFPDRKILQVSATHRLAQGFSQKSRDIIEATSQDFFGLSLKQSSASKFSFFDHDGGLNSAGVGGNIIGMGGDLIVVDDPYKSMTQALSPHSNQKVKTWWADLFGRQQPGASIILVMARWSQDDLAGWLLNEAKNDPKKPQWTEVKLPAVWDYDEPDYVMERTKGDLLWPGFFSPEQLETQRAMVGELVWSAQYQQNPFSSKDAMFPPDHWETMTHDQLPKMNHTVRYWDLSAGGAQSDFVVGVLMGIDDDGTYYIIDVAREKFIGDDADIEVEQFVRETSRADYAKDKNVLIYFEEVGGSGKAISAHYQREVLKGLPAEPHRKQGNKEVNAYALASHQKSRNVILSVLSKVYEKEFREYDVVGFDWLDPFVGELAAFPTNAKNDDQVDAASGAQQKLEQLFYEHGGVSKATAAFVNPNKEVAKTTAKQIDPNKILSEGISSQQQVNTRGKTKRAQAYGRKVGEINRDPFKQRRW